MLSVQRNKKKKCVFCSKKQKINKCFLFKDEMTKKYTLIRKIGDNIV
jgi:hypothetical protein